MAKKEGNTANKVEELIAPVVQGMGLRLWDVRFEKEGANWFLRIFIDSDDGISFDDCESVSRKIDPILDETDPIPQNYFLEVSSPGIERELKKEIHFESSLGMNIAVRLIRPIDDVRDFSVKLMAFDGKVIKVKSEDGEREFAIADCSYIKREEQINPNTK